MSKINLQITVAALIMLAGVSAFSQALNTGPTDLGLNGTVQETLTISLDQTTVSFVLTPGSATNPGSSSVNVTTTWNLASGRTAVALYAYFDSAASAMSSGSSSIPSAAISATVGGSSVGSFTNTVPFGTGVTLMNQPITSANQNGSKISAVAINVDLSSLPNLTAGNYTGTMHFQAQATP